MQPQGNKKALTTSVIARACIAMLCKVYLFEYVVREKGLEPPRRKAPDPKSGASANSATPAYQLYIY